MYVPAHFAMQPDEVEAMLSTLSAADLITASPDGLVATFLPLLYEPDVDGKSGAGRLLGHVARTNTHWQLAGGDGESLVIVRGPDGYVSPGWYASKREHGRVVPTWNYSTLHVHGRLVAHEDPDWLREVVTRLTDRHEATMSGTPWKVSDAPAAYLAGQLRAIVGLELQITRIEAKAKLSQNRPVADRVGVVAGLREIDPDDGVAAAIADQLSDSS